MHVAFIIFIHVLCKSYLVIYTYVYVLYTFYTSILHVVCMWQLCTLIQVTCLFAYCKHIVYMSFACCKYVIGCMLQEAFCVTHVERTYVTHGVCMWHKVCNIQQYYIIYDDICMHYVVCMFYECCMDILYARFMQVVYLLYACMHMFSQVLYQLYTVGMHIVYQLPVCILFIYRLFYYCLHVMHMFLYACCMHTCQQMHVAYMLQAFYFMYVGRTSCMYVVRMWQHIYKVCNIKYVILYMIIFVCEFYAGCMLILYAVLCQLYTCCMHVLYKLYTCYVVCLWWLCVLYTSCLSVCKLYTCHCCMSLYA